MASARHRDRLRRRLGLALLAGAVACLCAAPPALAATITSVTISYGGSQDADFLDDTAPNRSQGSQTSSVVSQDATSFQTHLTAQLGADAEAPGGSNDNIQFRIDYTITIGIDAGVGESWNLDVTNQRVGALTLVDDDGGTGRGQAALQELLPVVTGPTVTSGSLDLSGLNLNSVSGGNTPFDQSSNAILSGTGAGTVTLQFSFFLRTHTIPKNGDGDEAAVRMGIADALTAFTAGGYPGIGGRFITSDGHFVSATLIAPEPETFLTVSLGLLGLAVLGRTHERNLIVSARRRRLTRREV